MRSQILHVLNIRDGEAKLVSLLFVFYFLQWVAMSIFYTVAKTAFLSAFTIEELPWTYIAAAALMLLVGQGYTVVEHKLKPKTLNYVVVSVVTVLAAGLYIGYAGFESLTSVFLLLAAYKVIYQLNNLQFWGLAAVTMNVRQSKRLFSVISAGDVPARIIGYLLVPLLVTVMPVQHLLGISVVLFAVGLIILTPLLAAQSAHQASKQNAHTDLEHEHHAPGMWQSLFSNPFLLTMAALSLAKTLSYSTIDFSFLAEVKHTFHDKAQLAMFLGWFMAAANGLSLFFKLFLSSRLIHSLGVRNSLAALPVLLLVVVAVTLGLQVTGAIEYNLLISFGIMTMLVEVLKNAMHDPVFLSMFQPLKKDMRLMAHNLVKGVSDPLAYAISGALLLITQLVMHHLDLLVLDILLGISFTFWLILVFRGSRIYRHVLDSALKKRFLDSGTLNIENKQAIAAVQKRMESQHPEDVIYAIDLLCKADKHLVVESVPLLLSHQSPLVKMHILATIRQQQMLIEPQLVLNMLAESETIGVKEQALLTFCQMDVNENDIALPYLADADLRLVKATIMGMIRSGDIESVVVSGQRLLELTQSTDKQQKIVALDIIGYLAIRNFYRPVLALLNDSDAEVQHMALYAAGKVAHPRLVEPVFRIRHTPGLTKSVITALQNMGEHFLDFLALQGPITHEGDITFVLKVLEKLPNARAQHMLSQWALQANRTIAINSLEALRKQRFRATGSLVAAFEARLMAAGEMTYHALMSLPALPGKQDVVAIKRALWTEIEVNKRYILLILNALYGHDALAGVWYGMTANNHERYANALERLDVLLPKKYKQWVLTVMDESPLGNKTSILGRLFPEFSMDWQVVSSYILEKGDHDFFDWTQAITLTSLGDGSFAISHLVRCTQDKRPIIQNTAWTQLRKLHRTQPETLKQWLTDNPNHPIDMTHLEEEEDKLSLVEKVIVLKSTKLFENTPEHILTDIATIVHEDRLGEGEVIFKKGDFGNAMFIIYEGAIEIFDGHTVFATMGNRDFFGELALLDPEPRSASARASTDSLVFRLDQRDFFELMEERSDVMKGIIQILCRRLRTQNSTITSLQQKATA